MPAASPPRFLAIECSTDTLSVALGTGLPGDPVAEHVGPGGPQSSTTLLPAVQRLLDQAGWRLHDLSAIAFARGPGSFTGLRTACAVAQGLAYGTRGPDHPDGLPVLAIDTLQVLAETATPADHTGPVVALLDARMEELYLAVWQRQGPAWTERQGPRLCPPAGLAGWLAEALPDERPLLAGNVFGAYPDALGPLQTTHPTALAVPSAAALLRLAPGAWARGDAVPAHAAMPLYVRDKVARTTAEREQPAGVSP